MNRRLARATRSCALTLGSALMLYGCGPNVAGTYTDESGMIVLDLASGGEATFTVMGERGPCTTYAVEGDVVTVVCEDGNLDLTLNGDGSLNGPPGNMFGVLRRSE